MKLSLCYFIHLAFTNEPGVTSINTGGSIIFTIENLKLVDDIGASNHARSSTITNYNWS